MGQELPKSPLGGHWVEPTHPHPTTSQTAFSWDRLEKLKADQNQLRALFNAMVRVAGGFDWLAAALNRAPTYENKIRDAANGEGAHKVQLDWFAPLLEDTKAVEILMGWLSERLNYAPPVKLRTVTREEVAEATAQVVAEMGDTVREAVRAAVAKQLGVRVDEVKL